MKIRRKKSNKKITKNNIELFNKKKYIKNRNQPKQNNKTNRTKERMNERANPEIAKICYRNSKTSLNRNKRNETQYNFDLRIKKIFFSMNCACDFANNRKTFSEISATRVFVQSSRERNEEKKKKNERKSWKKQESKQRKKKHNYRNTFSIFINRRRVFTEPNEN